jgi:Cft2 family RNA processing exonuclease
VVIESTYGERAHPMQDPLAELREIILRTHERGGIVVIPTFRCWPDSQPSIASPRMTCGL